jgi:16S rRNA C967 or C1407 C5-methylase (RsmB/RsmF family)/NOL1/NOP2/fmu family ribosome biogenesis protein
MRDIPAELINSLKELSHFDSKAFIEAHKEENKITSIRLNPFKPLELDFPLGPQVKWCDNAYYLEERPSFTHDPLFHAGCYYVQEAGSMFLEYALRKTIDLSQDLKVLDLCGSPGGKSTLINSLITPESLLVANEVVKTRAGVLALNLSKWGTSNTIVTNNDPQKFASLESYFDVVVVDAPCSGSGLFRKQPEAIDEWSQENVNLCSARQKRILADILPALKENGILIYSTCSYSVEEDENIVEWLLRDFDLEYIPLDPPKDWGITETSSGYRFYPNLTKSEGFFLSALRKRSGQSPVKPAKFKEQGLSKAELEIISGIFDVQGAHFYRNGAQLHELNANALSFVSGFNKHFYLKKAGVSIGEIKGKDLVPNQDLAWSVKTLPGRKVNIDKYNALKYLKKENFDAESRNPGFSLISYKNQGLGWAKMLPNKMLPNRINNYLPNELRILN